MIGGRVAKQRPGTRTEPGSDLSAARLAALLKVSSSIASSLDLTVVLQTAIDAAVEVLQLDTGAFYLLDDRSLFLGATTPPLPADMPAELRYAALGDHPHIRDAVETGVVVQVHDAPSAALTAQERMVVEARGLRSVLYVPLMHEDAAVGVLIVGTQTAERRFAEEDIALCWLLSTQIALAVVNARLHESVLRANAEITRINAHLEALVAERTEDLASANEELRSQAEELQCQAAELEETADSLTASNEARARFLRAVNHELRSPLGTIIGASDLLAGGHAGELSADQLRQAEMIGAAARHLLALAESVLDLSRIDAGVLDLAAETIDAVALAAACADAASASAAAKGLVLVCELPDTTLLVTSDPVRLRQILTNLLDNAVKYTASGTITLEVAEARQGTVTFSVRDTGPGIPEREAEAVFQEFYRRPDHRSVAAGAGLGLAIARGLAQALGGGLTVRSVEGGGCTFTLTLPAGR